MSRAAAAAAATACALVAVGLVAPATPAAKPPPAPTAELCKGCLFVPAKGEHRPLLVLLHGDKQPPRRMLAAFRAAAARHDVALLTPPCPEELGCDRKSFWRWSGDPSWLADLVERTLAAHDLDPDRVALAGWSGGATYLGTHMAALGDRYSAAVLVGGGSPNASCAATPLPIFMLQGDRNPLHHLAVALRRRLEECHHDVTWQLAPRADHAAEWRALTRPATQRTIFDFLDAHPRAAATPETDSSAAPTVR